MNKAKLNYIIDILIGISFLIVLITGIIKFPTLSLISKKSYISFIHDWSGVIMAVLVFIHLILHWNWIVVVTKNIFKRDKGQNAT